MTTSEEIAQYIEADLKRLNAEPKVLAFDAEEYTERQRRVRTMMQDAGVETLIASSPESICYLHGYVSRWNKAQSPTYWPPLQCTILNVDHDDVIVFETPEHDELLRRYSMATDIRLGVTEDRAGMMALLEGELSKEGWLGGVVALEKWSPIPNPATSEMVTAMLVGHGSTVVDGSMIMRKARRRKSAAELRVIEEAQRLCDVGLGAFVDLAKPGATELEVWAGMVAAMAAEGGEPAGIHELVRVGPSKLGHAMSTVRVIAEGDCVSADPCGVVHRYHANAARAIWIGEAPEVVQKMTQIAAGAFTVIEQNAHAGASVSTVTRLLKDYYVDAGVWDVRNWLGGYELGIAFPPDWVGEFVFEAGGDADAVFEPNMVTNYESNIFYSMIDTFVYEESGARRLSSVPLDLMGRR